MPCTNSIVTINVNVMKKILFTLLFLPLINYGQVITTVAGNGILGYSGDTGLAIDAKLHLPGKVLIDNSGNLLIADSWNHVIRKVDATTGIITTIAGTGTYGYNGDNILATAAQLNDPFGLALDTSGNLYIGDNRNNRVRKIDHITGIITTFVGTGVSAGTGVGAAIGDGGLATNARLGASGCLAFDRFGNLYISDATSMVVRKVSATTGIISNFAGNGYGAGTGVGGYSGDSALAVDAELNNPCGIAFDSSGNLYIADYSNQRIRKVNTSTGIITTVAGNGTPADMGDGLSVSVAELNLPYDIVFDAAGSYYFAEFHGRVRKVNTTAIINTVAGTSVYGYNGDGILADTAKLNETTGIALDACGSLYIADVSNERIRKVTFPPLLSIPIISLSGASNTPVGSTVTVNATVNNAGSSYLIHWMNHGLEFTTTTVPVVTYTKMAGIDTVTAKVVPTGYGCWDSSTSAGWMVSDSTTEAPPSLPRGEELSVFPNPVRSSLTVEIGMSSATYRLLGIVGSVLGEGVLHTGQNSISMAALPVGVYVLEVMDPSAGLSMTKIVKE